LSNEKKVIVEVGPNLQDPTFVELLTKFQSYSCTISDKTI